MTQPSLECVRWLPRPKLGLVCGIVVSLCLLSVFGYRRTHPVPWWGLGVVRINGRLQMPEGVNHGNQITFSQEFITNGNETYIATVIPDDLPFPPFVSLAPYSGQRVELASMPNASTPTASDEREARALLAAWSSAASDRPVVLGPDVRVPVSPFRVMWNIAMGLMIAVVPLALMRWTIEQFSVVYQDALHNRLRRGQCSKCKYPIAGLPSESCPECGAFVPRQAIAAADARAQRRAKKAQATSPESDKPGEGA